MMVIILLPPGQSLEAFSNGKLVIIASSFAPQEQAPDQWNSIETPEIDPCHSGQLIFDRGGKDIQ